ncbi:cytochrome P450 [Aspergillus varians]
MQNLLVTPSSGPATVFTDGPVPDNETMNAALEKVRALNFNIESAPIVRLVPAVEPDVGVTVVVEGGKEYKLGYLGHKPYTVVASKDMITKLGVEVEENPVMGENVKTVDPLGSTNVKGVFVAGDAGTPMKAVANAIGSGANLVCLSRSHCCCWDRAAVDHRGYGYDIDVRAWLHHLLTEQSKSVYIVLGCILAYTGCRCVFRSTLLAEAFTNLISSVLNAYLTRRYSIKHLKTGQSIPGRPYRWPNGQGDAGKFLDGIENRTSWANEHGQIYRIWAGTKAEIVLQKPEHVKLVFRDSDRHFKAVNNDSGYLMGEVLGKCVGLISGQSWRALRGVSEPAFRHSSAIDYLDLIEARVGSYMKQCRSLRDGIFDPVNDFKFLPFLIIGDVLYGRMTREMEDQLCEMAPLREGLFQFVIKGGVARYSWSQYLPTQANRTLNEFRTRWAAFNQAAYRRSKDLNATETPVYQLFAAVDSGFITLDNAYQTLDEMLFANLDVTMGALSWNPVFLAAHPEAQEELYANIIKNIQEAGGSGTPQYLQSSSTYLAACILESSRLKPLAAFSVPQAAPTERILDGYVVPGGTNFIVDAYALNVENEFWGPDRHEYRPSRFLELKGSDVRYHMWRFGFGPRQCLGKYVADLILRVFLVHLVRDWKLDFGDRQAGDSRDWKRDLDTWITHPQVKLACTPRVRSAE